MGQRHPPHTHTPKDKKIPPLKGQNKAPFPPPAFFGVLILCPGKTRRGGSLRRFEGGYWKPNPKIRHPRRPPRPLPSLGPGFGPPKGFGVFREPLQAAFSGAGVGVVTEGEGGLEPAGEKGGGSGLFWGISGSPPIPGLVLGGLLLGLTWAPRQGCGKRGCCLRAAPASPGGSWPGGGEERGGHSAQPQDRGFFWGGGGVPEPPPPHPAAHDVPEHGGRRVRLDGVLAGVGERHAVAGVQESGPGGQWVRIGGRETGDGGRSRGWN